MTIPGSISSVYRYALFFYYYVDHKLCLEMISVANVANVVIVGINVEKHLVTLRLPKNTPSHAI